MPFHTSVQVDVELCTLHMGTGCLPLFLVLIASNILTYIQNSGSPQAGVNCYRGAGHLGTRDQVPRSALENNSIRHTSNLTLE